MVVASFAEVLSIGILIPFLSVLTSPERIFDLPVVQPMIKILNLTKPPELLLPLTMIFILATIFAGFMKLLLLFATTRISFAIGTDLSSYIYQRTLYQPYLVHCFRSSSEIIDNISIKASLVTGIITYILNILSAIVILILISIAIFSFDASETLFIFIVFGLIYSSIIWFTKKRQLVNSYQIARESKNVIQALQEGLGGIRDVLIDGSQSTYCDIYRNADLKMRHAQASNLFISACPRHLIEGLGMIILTLVAYFLIQQPGGVLKIIPTLGVFALGAQRLLPILQQFYAAWTSIRASQISLDDILKILDQPLSLTYDKAKPLPFKRHIHIDRIWFRYSSLTPYAIKNIKLIIPKGSRIGFIGATGHGKSTLLDIVMGLLSPDLGNLKIDGKVVDKKNCRAWQKHIAHVPQSIFLTDSSIEENIAFGIPKEKIDHQRVLKSAQQAQIAETIEKWPKKYQTYVGERGVRLSGGQRQRIGIARALYKESDVIILDEATSALDSKTESAVMEAIQNLGNETTLLIIAHRLSTLKQCSQIVELSNGSIKCIRKYKEVAS